MRLVTKPSEARSIACPRANAVLALMLIALTAVSAPAVADAPVGAAVLSRSRFLMGTACEVTTRGTASESIGNALDEIARVESVISTWRPDSELSRLNGSKRSVVSPELFSLLRAAIAVGKETQFAFNPLVGPLLRLWRVREGGTLPDEREIVATLPSLAIENARFDAATNEVTLLNGAEFEEGGFGKGYAIDRASALLQSENATSWLINFGGQIAVRANTPVEIAIASPSDRFCPAVVVRLSSGSLSTSSGSEKSFISPSGLLSHILDPRTGRALPPRGSVSVIDDSAMRADALSTALYVLGPETGLDWANAHGVAAIFLVPAADGWNVVASDSAARSALGLTSINKAFHIKGKITQ